MSFLSIRTVAQNKTYQTNKTSLW